MELISRWRSYAGDRVNGQAKRACIHEEPNGERLYAYVEHEGGEVHAWYEVAKPGEIEDVTIGRYPTEKEATAAIRRNGPITLRIGRRS